MITYCSRLRCTNTSCVYHQTKVPPNSIISVADRNDGCYSPYIEEVEDSYCTQENCARLACDYHPTKMPNNRSGLHVYDMNIGCLVEPYTNVATIRQAICDATQLTNYKCDEVCKKMCGNDGNCAYCATIADVVIERLNKEKLMEV